MSSTLTLAVFQQAADHYLEAKQQVGATWQPLCHCKTPGQSRQCLECPGFKGFVSRIQQHIIQSQGIETPSFPICTVPAVDAPYSDTVRHHVLKLYEHGFSIQHIKDLTGVKNKKTIRDWLYQAGLLRKQGEYSPEERAWAMGLYRQGLGPQEVEEKTRISADAISKWASDDCISRAKVNYSTEQRQRCLELYAQGKSLKEITAETGVHGPTACAWGKAFGIERPKRHKGRPRVHSDEVRQQCLDWVLKEGKTVVQVAMEMDISDSTLRKWVREAKSLSGAGEQTNTSSH